MAPRTPMAADARRRAALLLWLANIAIGAVVGANWLVHIPGGEEWRLLAFALPALLSTMVSLTVVPGALFVLAASCVRSLRWLGLVQACFWTVFQVLLFADTRIYNAFGYHFNGQVLNLMTTRGSEDAAHLGWQVWGSVALGLGLGMLLQGWIWHRALARGTRPIAGWLRPSIVWSCVLLPAVFVEKTIYAQADLARDRQITALARLFPLYARVPMEDLASRVFGVDVEKRPRVELEGFSLDYPAAAPELPAGGPRPNVLFVVIDCLRRDMLAAETMPAVSRWAQTHPVRRFEDHLSGGNSTRYGVFSMLYGLYGSYWFPFLQEERGPVLIDALAEEGYAFGVFSSATMSYPELRSTAWKRIPDAVHDDWPGEKAWERDEQAAAACAAWLRERRAGEPFFGFLLLDAPHQTYSHPPDARPFSPSAEELDYLAITRHEPDPALLLRVQNRYRNAVAFADGVAARVLGALDEAGLAEDTLVFVTGDHGEEFRECGFFGHTSAFTPQQVAVPLVAAGPGIEPGVETGPTSHLDLAPTILETLGADPARRGAWCLGASLRAVEPDRRRVVSGWNELGVWTPEAILRVPLSLLEFDVEVYDYRWRLIPDDSSVLRAEDATLTELGVACNRFLVKRPTP